MRSFLLAGLCLLVAGADAQPIPGQGAAAFPPLPQRAQTNSPIETFRRLLEMTAPEREQFLSAKTPQEQTYVRSKIDEYLRLPFEQREARLQALELRWYLLPLMQVTPLQRADRLAAVPEPYRSLIQQRLKHWDILPPPLQRDVLDNEAAIRFFAQMQVSGASAEEMLKRLPPERREKFERDFNQWQQLPVARREQMCRNFEAFFALDQTDRSRTLTRLSDAERGQMQRTLDVFEKLPVDERERVMEGFRKFNNLPPHERQAFLKSAERWQAMTEKDRQLWRRLVASIHAARAGMPPTPFVAPAVERPDASIAATNLDPR